MNISWQLLVDPSILDKVVDLLPEVKHTQSIDSTCRVFKTSRENIEAVTEVLYSSGERLFLRRVQYIGESGHVVKEVGW